ncbi:hypothetical protein [Burkholderia multivorans]|uniref:hypothetical protein n=1 Tax=Burkholderia multivorans TaxID=87883 RepID=UPI0020B31FF0|nr:hypothetical protein [Burkholderia multivorans]
MRDYAKISPQFWIGETGKKLRAAGAEAQVVALYLMTNPHANMLGLYYMPKLYIAHETGLGMEGACKGLQSCIEAGFCLYDEPSETVWVVEMAVYQIADRLSPNDKRSAGVQNEYNALPENPYLARFFEKYAGAFNMTKKRGGTEFKSSTFEAPSKPHASQEQEQEQEQEKTYPNPDGLGVASAADDPIPAAIEADLSHRRQKPSHPPCPHQQIIAAYHELLPASPRIRDWTPARADHLRCRWNEDPKRQNLDWWRRFFGYIAESAFLTGRATSGDRRPFTPGLDWICKAENFAKIREGRFHDEEAA